MRVKLEGGLLGCIWQTDVGFNRIERLTSGCRLVLRNLRVIKSPKLLRIKPLPRAVSFSHTSSRKGPTFTQDHDTLLTGDISLHQILGTPQLSAVRI